MIAQAEMKVLQSTRVRATINADEVIVKRADLEHEHRVLLERIQHIRQILGYTPLPTGKQRRKTIK